MISILDRYLMKQLLLNILLVSLVVMGLLFVFDFIEIARISASRNIGLDKILLMSLNKTPVHIQKVFGFLVMLSAMITVMKLSKQSELIAMRAAGFSVYKLLTPMLIVGFLVGVIFTSAINPITARLVTHYQKMEAIYLKGNPSLLSVSKTGLWMKQIDSRGVESIIHALRINKIDQQLHEVTFYFINDDTGFVKRIDAEYAVLQPNEWSLHNANITSEDSMNQKHELVKIETPITFERIQESLIPPESLSFWQLSSFINVAESSGLSVMKHKLYFYKLLIAPIFFLSMILLGTSFSLTHHRMGKINMMICGALASGFIIYFLSDIIMAFAISGTVPIWLSTIAPSAFAFGIGALLILQTEEIA